MAFISLFHYIALLQVTLIKYVHTSTANICNDPENIMICPKYNTCCNMRDQDGAIFTGCIPNNKAIAASNPNGQCCHDNALISSKPFLEIYGTGCGAGYHCASSLDSNHTILYYCEDDLIYNSGRKITLRKKPRYILAPASSKILGTVYGFPIQTDTSKSISVNEKHFIAYYSNHGSILSMSKDNMQRIRVVLVVIHGSGRNADDYMNVGMTMTKLQAKFLPKEIIVLAPRFLAPNDGHVKIHTENGIGNVTEPMRWDDMKPIEHTWRYGANALSPSIHLTSFDVIDGFIKHFITDQNYGQQAFENLELIVVIGHSAGGQFTQRWALLSDVPGWKTLDKGPQIRVIVANPRSYAYLDARRYINQTFKVPSKAMISRCPGYNQWEWGLDDGGDIISSYKNRIMKQFNTSFLIQRYAQRDVIYLSGSEDTEILHGSCEDDFFQGKHRRKRSSLFYKSLYNFENVPFKHKRIVVEGVDHNHALMFESDVSIKEVFEDIPYNMMISSSTIHTENTE